MLNINNKFIGLLSAFIWTIIIVLGFKFWHWDISQTVVFMHLGFFTLAFNYFLGLCWLDWKRIKHEEDPKLGIGVHFLGYLGNVLMFFFGFVLSAVIMGALISTYFYKLVHVKVWQQVWEKWQGQWVELFCFALFILVLDFVRFRRELKQLNGNVLTGWSNLAVFARNSKWKFWTYLAGSIVIMFFDGLLNDSNAFGWLSLAWLFVCKFCWILIDWFVPPQNQTELHTKEEEFF